ncbi:MAG: hypothetical protein MRERV_3c070 [Mycoplasmataceae bacterium RV_VA103A]|nr:MAG: hypothetical protein MRERV_3c070 [Mycoplasmataceae bacterium RV_VA103A]
MNLTDIWIWIKDKTIWAKDNWYVILLVFIGILIIIWFIKKLISDIKN